MLTQTRPHRPLNAARAAANDRASQRALLWSLALRTIRPAATREPDWTPLERLAPLTLTESAAHELAIAVDDLATAIAKRRTLTNRFTSSAGTNPAPPHLAALAQLHRAARQPTQPPAEPPGPACRALLDTALPYLVTAYARIAPDTRRRRHVNAPIYVPLPVVTTAHTRACIEAGADDRYLYDRHQLALAYSQALALAADLIAARTGAPPQRTTWAVTSYLLSRIAGARTHH